MTAGRPGPGLRPGAVCHLAAQEIAPVALSQDGHALVIGGEGGAQVQAEQALLNQDEHDGLHGWQTVPLAPATGGLGGQQQAGGAHLAGYMTVVFLVLFPSMPRPNLRRSQPLIREFCQQHGLLCCETSLAGSYAQALRHLSAVGRLPRSAAAPPRCLPAER